MRRRWALRVCGGRAIRASMKAFSIYMKTHKFYFKELTRGIIAHIVSAHTIRDDMDKKSI